MHAVRNYNTCNMPGVAPMQTAVHIAISVCIRCTWCWMGRGWTTVTVTACPGHAFISMTAPHAR